MKKSDSNTTEGEKLNRTSLVCLPVFLRDILFTDVHWNQRTGGATDIGDTLVSHNSKTVVFPRTLYILTGLHSNSTCFVSHETLLLFCITLFIQIYPHFTSPFFFFFFSTFFYSFDHLVSFSFFPSELPLEFLFLFFFSFLYFFSFWGCTHGIWKFPGQGSNWSYSCWAYVIAHGSPRSLSH